MSTSAIRFHNCGKKWQFFGRDSCIQNIHGITFYMSIEMINYIFTPLNFETRLRNGTESGISGNYIYAPNDIFVSLFYKKIKTLIIV